MAKSDIWMPLFIGDYLADTSRLTTEQHGAYLLILMDYWRNGAPPDDDLILSSIAKMSIKEWRKIKKTVMNFFTLLDGFWIQNRIEKEMEDAAKGKDKAAEKARLAAEARWKKSLPAKENEDAPSNATSNAPSIQKTMLEECPSQSQSQSLKPLNSKAEAKQATRLPNDWTPNDEDIAFCKTEKPHLNPKDLAEKFRDYWIAQPGVKGRKADWSATWRNWVRNERTQPQARGSPYQSRQEKTQAWVDKLLGNKQNARPPDIIDIN
jgi:uncharacterized protein YdaU (DUF1376 family)